MNKQFVKFLTIVFALFLFQTLFSIAFATPDWSELSKGSDQFFHSQESMSGLAYVTLSSSNLISLVNTSTHTEIGTINVGAAGCFFPWRATMSPDGAYVYVGCKNSGSVAVIETTGNGVVHHITAIPDADDIAFTRDGAFALVGSRWSNQIAVVNTTTYSKFFLPMPAYARSIAVHPFFDVAYVTAGNGTIQVLNTATFSIMASIPVGGEPWDVAVSPNGQWVFTGDRWGNGLHVIDANTYTVFTTITGLGQFTGLEVAPDGSEIYAANMWNGVRVINAQTFSLVSTITVPGAPWELAVTCDGSEIFVGDVSGQVPVIDTDTYLVTHQIPISGFDTRGIAICPQYVADGVFIHPASQTNRGAPGEMVAHEAILTNATGITDSFTLTLGGQTWDSSLSTTTIGPLAHGESLAFTVYVTVPVGTDWYLTDTGVVTATSVANPGDYLGTAEFTTEAYAPPQISVLPDALSSTQFVNEIISQTMTIMNGEGVTLTYTLYERDRGFTPALRPMPGHGEWLYQSEEGVPIQNARGEPDQTASPLNILVYAHNPVHPAPNTFIDQALQTLGLAYTAYYNGNWAGFENDLITGTWDMVLIGDDAWLPPPSTLNALNTYVLGGGKLILHTASLDSAPEDPLWTTMGFSFYDSVYPPPLPVEWWNSSHPAFNIPESVPELTAPNNPGYYLYGQYGNALSGFEAIAGYTPNPSLNQASLIIGNDRRTVFKGFLDLQGGADLDGDTKTDAVELWINLIDGLQTGFAEDVPWLSEAPITGTVTTNSSQLVDVMFDSNGIQPGEYYADLLVQSNDPDTPLVTLPVTMTVQPTANMGWVEGYVTDAASGSPLAATLIAYGEPYTVNTNPTTGYYKFWLDEGVYTVQVSASGYVSQTALVDITAQQGIIQDFELILNAPVIGVLPVSLETTLFAGESTGKILEISNAGPAALSFQFLEQDTTTGLSALTEYARSDEEMAILLAEKSATLEGDNQGLPTIARYPVESFAHLQGGTTILAWTAYTDYWEEYQNSLNAIAEYTSFTLMETATTNPSELAQQLASADVFLIPEQEQSDYFFLHSLGTTWTSVLNDFVVAGGTIVVLDHCFQSPGLLTGSGLMEINFYSCSGGISLNVLEPDHPLVENLPATLIGENGTGVYAMTNGANVIGAQDWNNNPVVATRDIGSGHVALIGLDFYQYNSDMAHLLANAINWSYRDVLWLSTIPVSGTVPAYDSLTVDVLFDTIDLQPGTYTANLIINSNDPFTPTVTLPVTMTVQPTSNMGSVSGMVTDAWTGNPLTAAVELVGVHTTTANPHYTIWAEAGTYALMAYAPGYYTATVQVTINAGTQTLLDLALEPALPRMEIASAITAIVPQGYAMENPLVISNTGPVPLTFSLHEVNPNILLNPAAPVNLNGKNILYDRAHGESMEWYFNTLNTALLSAGANIDYNDIYPINASILQDYDVLWINEGHLNWAFGELTAVMNWLNNGGAVLVHGTNTTSNQGVASIYDIFYLFGYCTYSQTTTDILSHPTTYGIGAIFIYYGCDYLSVPPEASVVVRDPWGQNHALAHEENGGKMVVVAAGDFFDWVIDYDDNLAFGLNVFNWLASPAYSDVPWFSMTPLTGTIPGHSSMAITLGFDATELALGSYQAVLAIEHNDPAQSSPLEIPVDLTVVAPQAGVSLTPATLQASGLPGETVVYTITLTNQGNIPDTFTLQVDSAWQANLSAMKTPVLAPGENYIFTLTVMIPAGAAEGEHDTATVTAVSNFDEAVTASVQATTTAYLEIRQIFLPIVVR